MGQFKCIEFRASDNEYLHKDFHGVLCYAIKYLDDNFGHEATTEYLKQVGLAIYKDLIQNIKIQGLAAIEKHIIDVFAIEGGEFETIHVPGKLTVIVKACPAIAHLKQRGLFYTERFCEATKVVNHSICQTADYKCSCSYEPGAGCCVQEFWK
ncbi:MAG: hypothetical protein A2Y12_09615 [Planctomycetes bacterium GWF2_42_9]|nr:MAG: hypothetical protein A2Y12_09615 [Planctomycetes bacterium GWF2_42_9]